MKKLLLSLGALTAVVAPVASVIACGTDTKSETPKAKQSVGTTVNTKIGTTEVFRTHVERQISLILKAHPEFADQLKTIEAKLEGAKTADDFRNINEEALSLKTQVEASAAQTAVASLASGKVDMLQKIKDRFPKPEHGDGISPDLDKINNVEDEEAFLKARPRLAMTDEAFAKDAAETKIGRDRVDSKLRGGQIGAGDYNRFLGCTINSQRVEMTNYLAGYGIDVK